MSDHCVMRDSGAAFHCLHCGTTEQLELPMELVKYCETVKAFCAQHKACEPHGEGLTGAVKSA